MTSFAVAVEVFGNLVAAITVLVFVLRSASLGLIPGLRLGMLGVATFCASNVFYGVAYFGRTTDRFELWDTTAEQIVRALQISTFYVVPIAMVISARAILRGVEFDATSL